MKKLYAAILLLGVAGIAKAQSLQFTDNQGTDISGTTITKTITCADITANGSLDVGAYGIDVKNTSGNSLDVKIKRFETSVPSGTENYFCWFVCYAAQNSGIYYEWPVNGMSAYNHKRTIPGGASDTNFFAHHVPNGICQSATYRYVAYDGNNTNDSAYIDIVFDVTVGTNDIEKTNINAKEYPNPTSDVLMISLNELPSDANLVVSNMVGAIVKRQSITNLTTRLNTEDLSNGVYFYTIKSKNAVLVTRKFIVSK